MKKPTVLMEAGLVKIITSVEAGLMRWEHCLVTPGRQWLAYGHL